MIKTILLLIFVLIIIGYITYCHFTTLSAQKKDTEDINNKIEELNNTMKSIKTSITELEKDINNTNK